MADAKRCDICGGYYDDPSPEIIKALRVEESRDVFQVHWEIQKPTYEPGILIKVSGIPLPVDHCLSCTIAVLEEAIALLKKKASKWPEQI